MRIQVPCMTQVIRSERGKPSTWHVDVIEPGGVRRLAAGTAPGKRSALRTSAQVYRALKRLYRAGFRDGRRAARETKGNRG